MDQRTNVKTEIPITAGTNIFATLSASFWIGALLRLASFTILMILESKVSSPIFSVFIRKVPLPLMVPDVTLSPVFFSAGIGSPVIIDSSILEFPSIIFPSTGTFSPGFTLRISLIFTSESATFFSFSLMIKLAVSGERFISASMAFPVFWWAPASSI